jgi:uncharacterized membrane protein
MNKLVDLRFIIGFFFFLIGMLLLGYILFDRRTIDSNTINLSCGLVFITFGLAMIFISFLKKERKV